MNTTPPLPISRGISSLQNTRFFLALALGAQTLCGGFAIAAERHLKDAEGAVLKGEITKVEPDGLTLVQTDGVRKVAFTKLAREVQVEFGYDAAKARDYARSHNDALAGQRLMQEEAAKRIAKSTPAPATPAPAPRNPVPQTAPLLMNQGPGAPVKTAPPAAQKGSPAGLSIGRLGKP